MAKKEKRNKIEKAIGKDGFLTIHSSHLKPKGIKRLLQRRYGSYKKEIGKLKRQFGL